jgi:dihydrofolate reductase
MTKARKSVARKPRREPVAQPLEAGLRTEVIYSAGVSLDGFIADENGGVDWLHAAMVPGEGYGLEEFMASVDAILIGSLTYEKMLGLGGGGSGSRTPSWVFSSRSFKAKGRMTVTSESPAQVVASLPQQGIRRAWLMGGGKLASSFLAAGLIDELSLGVMPVVLGRGIPLFDGGIPVTSLRLVESKPYKGGALGVTYRFGK